MVKTAVVNTTRLKPENTLILNEIGTFIAVQVLQPGIHGPQTLYSKGLNVFQTILHSRNQINVNTFTETVRFQTSIMI